MHCLLAAVISDNNDMEKNKNRMITLMKRSSGQADIILFGEAYLQGFYAMKFNYSEDAKKAICLDDPVVREIAQTAAAEKIAVSFGFFEKAKEKIYSSQMMISAEGKIIDVYRRITPGWKEPYADDHYAEGKSFHTFHYLKKEILVGTCGDLWEDGNIAAIRELSPDVVFWPVYTDFNFEKWNTILKLEYAKQVKDISAPVLYVNSLCPDQEGTDLAKGGAAVFYEGKIIQEVPAGEERVLEIEIS